MNNYIKSAISKLYGEDDDFILLGLTGQTGSGCSTVAEILSSEKKDIRHSLFKGYTPKSNNDRKEVIIRMCFENTWEKYKILQVRSILTLLLVECGLDKIKEYILKKTEIEISDKKLQSLMDILKNIEDEKDDKSEFYTNKLAKLSNEIREILGENSFVKLYQVIGTNIRMSGNPIDEKLVEGKFFTLAEKINEITKEIKAENDALNKPTFLVIDTLRNPLEALFFQERYSSFYLMAVSCSNSNRRNRLIKMGYSEKNITELDEQEYKRRKINDEESYSIQDIRSCLERADLYISNPDEDNSVSKYKILANQIIKFTSLMKRPGLISPSPIERCMQIAYTAKLNSGCISRQVGAVITDPSFSIQSVGWNDTPHAQVPCNLRNRFNLLDGKDQVAYSNYEKNDKKYIEYFTQETSKYLKIKKEGRNISYCFKSEFNNMETGDNQVHTRSLHAEENAFLQITKYGGRGVKGGNLFTTASPCELCSKKAYQLGIKNIYYIDPYPGIATSHILEGGSMNPNLNLFFGAIGRAFHRLYTPIVPYKDELNALIDE